MPVLAVLRIVGVGLRPVIMMRVILPTRCGAQVLRHRVPRAVLRQTQHGSSHRAPDREQEHQQQQQPDAQSFHGFSLSHPLAGATHAEEVNACSFGCKVNGQGKQIELCHRGKVKGEGGKTTGGSQFLAARLTFPSWEASS